MANNNLKYTIYNGYFNDNVNFFFNNTDYKTVTSGSYTGFSNNISSITAGINGSTLPDWNYFSIEWLGYFKPDVTGTWTFYTNSDDASFVWVGDNAISGFTTTNALVNNGGLHGPTWVSGNISLVAGTYYPIRIQYGQNNGGVQMVLYFSGPPGSSVSSWTTDGSNFYSNMNNNLSFTVYDGYFWDDVNYFDNNTNYKIVSSGSYTGFTNNISSIDVGTNGYVPNDSSSWSYYSVQWLGYFIPDVTGTWTFRTASDDASYVWIGNNATSGYTTANALVNNGGGHVIQLRSNTINLVAGTYYPIRIQFGTGVYPYGMCFDFQGPIGSSASSLTSNGSNFFACNLFLKVPTLSGFTITSKTYGDSSFTITKPTSNIVGIFGYTSSNTYIATISGSTVTIVGTGTSTITATQAATSDYYVGTITTTLTVNNRTPTISNFTISSKVFGDSSFTITQPTSNSSGTFSYTSSDTSVATISGSTVTIVGSGTSTITATQSAITNYNVGTATTTLTVNKGTPTITGFPLSSKTYGDSSFTITQPTSNSSGTFSYTSSDTSVATISGSTVTIVGTGTSTITATQAATTNYNKGTATTTFTVNKGTPIISNFSLSSKVFGDSSFTITQPTSTSSGTFSYTSSDTSVATISGSTVTIVGAGTSTIFATQAATTNYNAIIVTTSFTVNKGTPTITGFPLSSKTFGDSSFLINLSSNSSGSFSYTSSDTSVATITGSTVSIVGAGTSTITAIQAATTNYNGISTTTTFTVNKGTPTISNFSLSSKVFGDSPFTITQPTSTSSGTFSYTSSNTSVATISGSTVTIVGSGTSTITATQATTTNYNAGTTTTTLTVNKGTPTISNFSLPSKVLGDSPFTITQPISTSSGTFSYTSSNTSVATISGSTVTIVGSGTSTIIATQAATTNYNAVTIITIFYSN